MSGPPLRHVEHVMGTAIVFDLPHGDSDDAVARAVGFLHWVDTTFSVYRPSSEIRRIARSDLDMDSASPEVRFVLGACEQLRSTTGGWFDHRPASSDHRLDPSGYVKGWSIDEAALILRVAGITDYCISAGGDVRTAGRPAPDRAWRIGVRHPDRPGETVATVSMTDGAVATSGRYERGEHVWPPSSDETTLLGATSIGPELATADALATAVLAADRVLDLPARFPDYRFLTVDTDLRVTRHGWPDPTLAP